MADDIKAEIESIGKIAADTFEANVDSLTESIKRASDPFLAADLIAANVHRNMAIIRDSLTASTPLIPTRLYWVCLSC